MENLKEALLDSYRQHRKQGKDSAGFEDAVSSGERIHLSVFGNRPDDSACRRQDRQQSMAMVMTQTQAIAAMDADVDILVLDGPVRDHPEHVLNLCLSSPAQDNGCLDRQRRPVVMAALPQVLRIPDISWLENYLEQYRHKFSGFVVRNLEEMEFLRENGHEAETLMTDSSLYCWNRSSLHVLTPYCGQMILPLELSCAELTDTFGESASLSRMILFVYGRAPMMISANCILKTAGYCRQRTTAGQESADSAIFDYRRSITVRGKGQSRSAESCFAWLKDRTNALFPVFTDCQHCQNVIYNSVPTSLDNCIQDLQDRIIRRVGGLLMSFTTETGDETAQIIRLFSDRSEGLAESHRVPAPSNHSRGNNMPNPPIQNFTYGHYRRKVL